MVGLQHGSLIAKRPVPEAAPDATFLTRHVSFQMTAPDPTFPVLNNVNNTVEKLSRQRTPGRGTPGRETWHSQGNTILLWE